MQVNKRQSILGLSLLGMLIAFVIIWIRRPDPHTVFVITSPISFTSVIFSPDGRMVATGSEDGQIQLRSVVNGHIIRSLIGHSHEVWGLAFSPNGHQLVSAAADGTVRLWDVATGNMTRLVLKQPFDAAHTLSTVLSDGTYHTIFELFYSVAFSPDGKLLAVGTDQGRVILIGLDTDEVLQAFQGHEDISFSRIVTRVAFSNDGQFIASLVRYGGINLWQVAQPGVIHAFTSPYRTYSMIFSPDSPKLVMANQMTGLYDTWNLPNGPLQPALQPNSSELTRFKGDASGVSATMSLDSHMVAIGGGLTTQSDLKGIPFLGPQNDPRIFVWHAGEIQPAVVLRGHQDNVIGLSFSPDNKLLASVSWDHTMRLWRIED